MNNKLYKVVIENEDDPYCAHWDETLCLTHSIEHAKEFVKSYMFDNDGNLRNCECSPRIEVLEYNDKEYVSCKTGPSILSTNFNEFACENIDELYDKIEKTDDMHTEKIKLVIATNDVFLGRICFYVDIELVLNPDKSLFPEAVVVMYENEKIIRITNRDKAQSEYHIHDLLTSPIGSRSRCLLWNAIESVQNRYKGMCVELHGKAKP